MRPQIDPLKFQRNFLGLTQVFIIGFWVVMMGLLVQKEFLPQNIPLQSIRFPRELPYIKSWGIYAKGGRIGHLKDEILSQPDGYLWKNEVVIRFLQDMPIYINGISEFDTDGRLDNFQIKLSYGDFAVNADGKIEESMLKIRINNGENVYSLPWSPNVDIMNNTMIPWFYIKNMRVGDKFQWYILNPLTQTKGLVKALVRRSSLYYNKRDFVPVIIVDMYYQDMKFEFWVDNECDPIKVVTPWGWELAAE